jgi:hypothetical protein
MKFLVILVYHPTGFSGEYAIVVYLRPVNGHSARDGGRSECNRCRRYCGEREAAQVGGYTGWHECSLRSAHVARRKIRELDGRSPRLVLDRPTLRLLAGHVQRIGGAVKKYLTQQRPGALAYSSAHTEPHRLGVHRSPELRGAQLATGRLNVMQHRAIRARSVRRVSNRNWIPAGVPSNLSCRNTVSAQWIRRCP